MSNFDPKPLSIKSTGRQQWTLDSLIAHLNSLKNSGLASGTEPITVWAGSDPSQRHQEFAVDYFPEDESEPSSVDIFLGGNPCR